MSFHSLEEGLHFVEKFCETHQIDEEKAYKLKLIAEELITNIFKHTDAREYFLFIQVKERISLQLEYASSYFNMQIDQPKQQNVENLPYGGLGLFLIQQIALKFQHSYKEGRNIFEVIL